MKIHYDYIEVENEELTIMGYDENMIVIYKEYKNKVELKKALKNK